MATSVESNVRAYRAAAGLSQMALGGLSRTSAATIRACERGRILDLKVHTLTRVAAALGCGVADLWPILGSVRDAESVSHPIAEPESSR